MTAPLPPPPKITPTPLEKNPALLPPPAGGSAESAPVPATVTQTWRGLQAALGLAVPHAVNRAHAAGRAMRRAVR